MNTEEQNNTHRIYFLKNLLENPNVSVLNSNEIRLFQRNVPVKAQLKFLMDASVFPKIFA